MSVFISGGANVRAYSADSFNSYAAYWKNLQEIIVDSLHNCIAYGIFVSESNVYTCGVVRDWNGSGTSKRRALYWKNGELYILCREESIARKIAVINNHVYVIGNIGERGALWIDGELFYTLKHYNYFSDMKVVQK